MNPARPMGFTAVLAWAAAVIILLHVLVLGVAAIRPNSLHDLVSLGICEALGFVILSALVLRVHNPESTLAQAFALRPAPASLVVICFLAGLCLRVPADFLRTMVETLAPTPPDVLLAESELLHYETPLDLVKLLAVLVVAGPLVEELFYRGALFGPLIRARGTVGVVAATSLAFVLAHGQWRDFPSLVLVAVSLGYVRAASGSLLPAYALHVAFNLSAIWVSAVGIVGPAESLTLSPVWTASAWALVFSLLAGVHRIAMRNALAIEAREEDVS
jgi:membrane protease YdiL (CAAX protease family)